MMQGYAEPGDGAGMQAQPEGPRGDEAATGNTPLTCIRWASKAELAQIRKQEEVLLSQQEREGSAAVPSASDRQQDVNSQSTGCITHHRSCSESLYLIQNHGMIELSLTKTGGGKALTLRSLFSWRKVSCCLHA